MTSDDFIGTAVMEKSIMNRKVSVQKVKINWLSTRQISLQRSSPFYLAMRQSFDGNDDIVDLKKRGGRHVTASDFFSS